jgi:hypothetical protein
MSLGQNGRNPEIIGMQKFLLDVIKNLKTIIMQKFVEMTLAFMGKPCCR